MSPLLRAISAVAIAAIAIVACVTDDPEASPCRDIPDGGCPLAFGVACDDPLCAAAYACNPDGTWTLSKVCPVVDAGPPSEAGDASPASDAPRFAGFDVSNIDAPPGSYGGTCQPALQDGDCQVGVVLSCGDNVDPCCGCDALYACQGGQWVPYGYCGDEAGLTVEPDLARWPSRR